MRKNSKENLANAAEIFHPGLSVDFAVFGFHEGTMKILLNKFLYYDSWMLPGGFVYKDEDLDSAAVRALQNRTGLDNFYIQQFHTFGNKSRTKADENTQMCESLGYKDAEGQKGHWLINRFVSVGYYALVEYSKVQINANDDEKVAWFDLDEIPTLYSDHNHILESALLTIRLNLLILPIGYELLPEKFTMLELRLIYETIVRKKLDRRNFQRKMLSNGLIDKLDEPGKKWGAKTATLYSFNKEKYDKALVNGFLINDIEE